jgi:hypothetical protein
MIVMPRARWAGAALRAALRAALLVVGSLPLVGSLPVVAGGAVVPSDDIQRLLTAERGANAAPIAADDRASVDAGGSIDDRAPGLLFNDIDPDGDPLVAIRDSGPGNGTVIVRRDGSWSYTPAPGFIGVDTFTYVVSDGLVTSEPATVSITVRGDVRATPVATSVPTTPPSPDPSPSPVAPPSPTPSPSPTPRPVPAVSPPPAPPAANAFTIPEPPASTLDMDDIGLAASEVAGLGPVLWTVPAVLLAVPGVVVLLAAVAKATRSRRLAARRARSD